MGTSIDCRECLEYKAGGAPTSRDQQSNRDTGQINGGSLMFEK